MALDSNGSEHAQNCFSSYVYRRFSHIQASCVEEVNLFNAGAICGITALGINMTGCKFLANITWD